jgi:hypothetical protein
MRLRPIALLLLVAALAGALLASGCGAEEEEEEVGREGEPFEVGELVYNIQITRFLNPDSQEDATYLEGAPPLGPGQQYLAVFMTVENEGEEANVVPDPLKVVDTRGTIYEQLNIDNPFALIPGTPVEPDEQLPLSETAAANGPIKGAMALFILDEESIENRPLELEIPGPGEVGHVELDI